MLNITRRAVLGAPALALPSAIPLTLQAAQRKDPHPLYLARWREARDAINAPGLDEDSVEAEALYSEMCVAEQLISTRPAATARGLVAQLVFFRECFPAFVDFGYGPDCHPLTLVACAEMTARRLAEMR
ncbi:hypothetical protein [Oceanicella sp. SM1341]|uniref:hypothetical protein n=1 Tax=Oceanicella sp. SM1341 TaxID=1548889 RepID=UPI000E50F857|nr:hypothetical protein [Oceanicella sp. SM1341]